MKYVFILVLLILTTGCGSMTLSERIKAGGDAGAWSLCNYPYPYVKGRAPGSKCDELWDKYNNYNTKEPL